MKIISLFIILFLTLNAFAEGVLSFTKITPENLEKLNHHSLRVERKSQDGKSFIALFIVAEKETPLLNCDVKVYAPNKKKVLVQFSVKISTHPKNPTYFYVADELVERAEVQYSLRGNKIQSHEFIIEAGKLNSIALTQ